MSSSARIKLFFKESILALFFACASDLAPKASILMYHSIGRTGAFFEVTPEDFEKQIRYVKSKKFDVVFLSELIKRKEHNENVGNCVVFTFDDGYVDNFTAAFPLLQKYQIPATIFLVTGLTQLKNSENTIFQLLNEKEIKIMQESGIVEFLPHTKTHPELTKLDEGQMREEINTSRRDITALSGKEPSIFAYPKGKYDSRVLDCLKEIGFHAAVTVREGLVSLQSDPLTLPRNTVDSGTTFFQFKVKLSGAIEFYANLKEKFR